MQLNIAIEDLAWKLGCGKDAPLLDRAGLSSRQPAKGRFSVVRNLNMHSDVLTVDHLCCSMPEYVFALNTWNVSESIFHEMLSY